VYSKCDITGSHSCQKKKNTKNFVACRVRSLQCCMLNGGSQLPRRVVFSVVGIYVLPYIDHM
jgi:hypothetical protein